MILYNFRALSNLIDQFASVQNYETSEMIFQAQKKNACRMECQAHMLLMHVAAWCQGSMTAHWLPGQSNRPKCSKIQMHDAS